MVINNHIILKSVKPRFILNICSSMCLFALLIAGSTASAAGSEKRFPAKVNQFLNTYCVSCHGPKKQKGDIRFDKMSQDLVNGGRGDDWHEALDALILEEMPPKKADKKPSKAERAEIVSFLQNAFKKASEERRSTGGKVVMRRLNNDEYNNTMNDLFGLNEDFSKDFPPDSESVEGFKNNGSVMRLSPLQINNYIEAAKLAVDLVIYEGKQPALKTVDIKNVKFVKSRAGKNIDLSFKKTKQNASSRFLFWEDSPKEGPVLVDIELKGIKDLTNLDRSANLIAGLVVKFGTNRPVLSFKKVLGKPKVTRKGNITHLQYLIPKIEEFPQVGEHDLIPSFMFHFKYGQKASPGLEIVSFKAKGPYYATWPPPSHRRIFIPSKNEQHESVYAKEILKNFMTRAWRRPVTDKEVESIYKNYQSDRKSLSFVKAIKNSLIQVLVSPNFLFLVEPKEATAKIQKLDSNELANRLSYFLWASKADTQLYSKTQSASPESLRAEVRRMIKDERSWRFVENFTTQWLELHKIDTIAVSPEIYPGFNDDLKEDMSKETQHFFAHILRENLSAMNFIDSDFSFQSERLQKHYGGKGGHGSTVFKKVKVNKNQHRGGILAHASVLLANSDGEDSHLINRAVWLADKILGDPPPPPPADVDTDLNIEGFEKMSKKQQITAHVEQEACARCHTKFDPFGVAFESFDAVGAFRTKIRKLDQKELDRRRNNATSENPAIEFKKIDKNSDGFIQKKEWYALNPKTHEKAWQKISGARADRRGSKTSEPKGVISLEEFKNYKLEDQRKTLAKINSSLPYIYVAADPSTVLPDNTKINNFNDLKSYLLNHKKDEFAENMVRRLLTYALGRSLEFSDDQAVK